MCFLWERNTAFKYYSGFRELILFFIGFKSPPSNQQNKESHHYCSSYVEVKLYSSDAQAQWRAWYMESARITVVGLQSFVCGYTAVMAQLLSWNRGHIFPMAFTHTFEPYKILWINVICSKHVWQKTADLYDSYQLLIFCSWSWFSSKPVKRDISRNAESVRV